VTTLRFCVCGAFAPGVGTRSERPAPAGRRRPCRRVQQIGRPSFEPLQAQLVRLQAQPLGADFRRSHEAPARLAGDSVVAPGKGAKRRRPGSCPARLTLPYLPAKLWSAAPMPRPPHQPPNPWRRFPNESRKSSPRMRGQSSSARVGLQFPKGLDPEGRSEADRVMSSLVGFLTEEVIMRKDGERKALKVKQLNGVIEKQRFDPLLTPPLSS
jgi:hypothetical protein